VLDRPARSWLSAGAAVLVAGCLDWGALEHGACGDGFVGPEESCDDGNALPGDGCDATCRPEAVIVPVEPFCGDGRVNAAEACDDGNSDDGDVCLSSCVPASCGDGVLWEFVEQCDDGARTPGDGCSAECDFEPPPEPCGDGDLDEAEECDDGNRTNGDGCSQSCAVEPPLELCGNGVLDGGEACDDGNTSNSDRCLKGCSHATCGDGQMRAGVEECDDGNLSNDDGCTRACLQCGAGASGYFRAANGHCYELYEQPTARPDARVICHEKGGEVWTVNAEAEENDVLAALLSADGDYWIGMSAGSELSWVSGDTVNYQNFAMGQPSGTSSCVSLTLSAGAASWLVSNCTRALPFICERGPGFVFEVTHHAYRVFSEKLAFSDALAACSERGGYVATLETDEERLFVASKVDPSVWVGATDLAIEGSFSWLSGAPVDAGSFLEGEPNDADGSQDCVALSEDTLGDEVCDTQKYYVCEYE
jgi:cysteine-rich repeat protein